MEGLFGLGTRPNVLRLVVGFSAFMVIYTYVIMSWIEGGRTPCLTAKSSWDNLPGTRPGCRTQTVNVYHGGNGGAGSGGGNSSSLAVLHPNVNVFHWERDYVESCIPYCLPHQDKPTATLCTYTDKQDPGISWKIRKDGTWEKDLQNQFFTAVQALGSGKESDPAKSLCMVDFGCNIGTFTISAASLGYKVLGVDALVTNLNLLATSVKMNGYTDMVTLVYNGVAEKRQKLAIENCQGCGPGSSIISPYSEEVHGSRVLNHKFGLSWAVLADDLIPLVPTRNVVLKMDIEGAETNALRGASQFFKTFNVVAVLMEWDKVARVKKDSDFVIEFLTSHGLKPHPNPSSKDVLDPATDHQKWPSYVYWSKD